MPAHVKAYEPEEIKKYSNANVAEVRKSCRLTKVSQVNMFNQSYQNRLSIFLQPVEALKIDQHMLAAAQN